MSVEITEELIKEFIEKHLNANDFGYLVVPSDEQLNSEALINIKSDFKAFIKHQDV